MRNDMYTCDLSASVVEQDESKLEVSQGYIVSACLKIMRAREVAQ